MHTLAYRCGVVLIVIVALCFRVVGLDRRVMHNDEANQACRTGLLLDEGTYRYDSSEHHGPTLYYLSLPLAWLTAGGDFTRTTEITFRLLPAIAGVAAILLLLLLRDGLGKVAVCVSAALAAVSPAMVYFSRFYIQEMLLLCFTAGAIVCSWHYVARRTLPRAICVGVFVGLMHATKETCIIAYASMVAALLPVLAWKLAAGMPHTGMRDIRRHVCYMLLAAFAVSAILFSSFLTHPAGVWYSFATYPGYIDKGIGNTTDHVQPFLYYLRILVGQRSGGLFWSEWIIPVLALTGMAYAVMAPRRLPGVNAGLARFLALYTLLMTFAYCLIPYKTPWCMLSFLYGWILMAGIGAAGLLGSARTPAPRVVVMVLLVTGTAFLVRQAYHAAFRYAADVRNPYAYAHTLPDLLNLVQRVENVTALEPGGNATPIAVITNPQDAWPLPWYFRNYARTGYWNDASELPDDFAPAIMVASQDTEAQVDARAAGGYQKEYWGLRNEVPLALYIRDDLWSRFMQTRQ